MTHGRPQEAWGGSHVSDGNGPLDGGSRGQTGLPNSASDAAAIQGAHPTELVHEKAPLDGAAADLPLPAVSRRGDAVGRVGVAGARICARQGTRRPSTGA